MAGTDSSYNTSERTWSVTFPNYTVSGIASCNNSSGTYSTASPEYNNVFNTGTSGVYCWCRMTNPVRSAWVFNFTGSNNSYCISSCAADCAYDVRNDKQLRGGVFGSAGQ